MPDSNARNEASLANAIEGLPVGVLICDETGTILETNSVLDGIFAMIRANLPESRCPFYCRSRCGRSMMDYLDITSKIR